MMPGIRRLVVYTAAIGLLAAGAVSASLQTANAQDIAAACGGNGANDYICNIDATVSSPGTMLVNVTSGDVVEEVNVQWTVTCADSTGSEPQEGATDNADTPLNVDLTPLPPTAADGTCTVNVGITLPKPDITPAIAFVGELEYTPASSTTVSAVHPIKGYDGKCVSDDGNSSANGSEIQIWSCSSTNQAENWKFSNNELIHNGKCANDKADGGKGSRVVLYTCDGAANSKWTSLSNGELRLQAHNGTLCLNDPRSSKTNGTQLIVYTCNDSANEKWSLP